MNNRLIATLALLAALALFFGYVHPTWTVDIAEMNAAIASDEEALLAASQYRDRQNELLAARAAINPTDLEHLMTFLPDGAGNVGMILDLTALASRSGLSLSNIDVATAGSSAGEAQNASGQSASPVSSIDLSLSAVGTYASLHKFLDGLERSQRLVDVRTLAVSGSDSGVYTYQLTLRIYWLR